MFQERLFIPFPKNQLTFQERDYLFHSSKNLLIFQEIDYLFHSPKNQQMFQEREIIYSIPEKPADISRDKLFIPFPKNLLMFQERLAVLFQNRS